MKSLVKKVEEIIKSDLIYGYNLRTITQTIDLVRSQLSSWK